MLRQNQPPRRRPHAGKVLGLARTDAPEGGQGKPCGASHIPKAHKCSKGQSRTRNVRVAAAVLGTAAVVGLTAAALRNPKPNQFSTPTATRAISSTQEDRFLFAPEQFRKDLAKLSRPTQDALLENHEQSALEILSVNTAKDFVIARFDNSGGRWSNEHIGVSTSNGRVLETRAEQRSRGSSRWDVQFTVDRQLTRIPRKESRLGKQEDYTTTRALLSRIKSMMVEHTKHMPSDAVFVASPVLSDGAGRGRAAVYRRLGFKPDPDSALAEFELEVPALTFVQQARTRRDIAWF